MAYKIMGTTPSPFYINMMIYYIMCDTPADLPSTISDIGYGTIIGYGSRADIISDSSKYIWNGSQWVRQTTGGGGGASSADQVSYDNTDSGLTATNVQDAIDELKDIDDTQDNALVELYGENANQQLEINYAINTGSKNKLIITNQNNTLTINGVTFTVNADQTVSLSGTATATATFVIVDNATSNAIPDGSYILTGCPSGGGNNTYDLRWYLYSSGKSAYDQGSGASVNKTGNTTSSNIAIVIRSGVNTDGLVFRPMLRNSEITDAAYVPYAPTNRELYETKADKGTFDITIASAITASEYSYSCITTGDIATVCIRIVLADGLNANTSYNLFQLPSGTYPRIAIAGTGYADSKVCMFWINTGGLMRFTVGADAIPSGASINANFCYSYKASNWTTVTANQLQSLNSPLMLNREEIMPLETNETEETEEIEETE